MFSKMLVISDIHRSSSALNWVPDLSRSCDALLILGDVTTWGDNAFFERFLSHLARKIPRIYFIPGNHDPKEMRIAGVESLHGETKIIEDTKIAGLGGSNPTPFNTPFEMDDDSARAILERFPPNLTILASHAPPYSTKCDVASDHSHIGSKPVRQFIEEKNPRFTLSGHVHESRGTDYLGGCLIANVGPAAQGFYALVTLGRNPQIQLEQMRHR